MSLFCALGIARFSLLGFRSRKTLHGADLQSSQVLDSVGDGVAKSGIKQSKQSNHKRLSWVYCAKNSVSFF